MDVLFNTFLIIHIVSGSGGLVSGLINVIQKKGGKSHVIIGRIFAISMLTAGISSLVLAAIRPNPFLFVVGIFTLYLVGTGLRYIQRKGRIQINPPKPIDYFLTAMMGIAGILLVVWGGQELISENWFGLVFISFGGIGLVFVRDDWENFRDTVSDPNHALIHHLRRMTAGFIASTTAFLAVNYQLFPDWIPGFLIWLLPTLMLSPLIGYWSRKYTRKTT